MQLSTLAKRGSLVLFLAVVAFYFYGLGHLPLLGPDEPRYAQIAREMFLRGDLITPTLGGHPWFEKPALLYWMMILSYKLFGVSELTARLPAAVAGLLTVCAIFYIGRTVERLEAAAKGAGTAETAETRSNTGLGFWSAVAAATMLGIIVFARAASFDIIVTMTMTWALALFLGAELKQRGDTRRGLLAGFYVFIGLSLLAKGLIGIVIPLSIVGAYYLLRRRMPERKVLWTLVWGIPLSLAVAAVWYAPVIWRHGWEFVDQFFIQHQLARYVSNKFRHPAPVYFYLLILVPLSLPWTAFIIDGLAKARPWRRPKNREADATDKLLMFAFAWFLVPLLFFSFSTSKLPGYILPVLPALALFAGQRLTRLSFKLDDGKWAIRLTSVLCVLLAVAVPVYGWRIGWSSVAGAAMIALFLGVAGAFALIAVRYRASALLVIAAATLGVIVVALNCLARPLVEPQTARHLLQLADARGYSQTTIYGLQRDDRTPEFYAAGRVAYGPDREPVMFEDVGAVAAESLARKETLLVFVQMNDVGYLTRLKSAQTEVIGNNGRLALVAVTAR